MAIRPQPSFASGELDPALHERTTLQKFSSGLKTGRCVVVGKTGRLVSKPGRKHFAQTNLTSRKCIIHTVPYVGVFLEWGHNYVRVYKLSTGALLDEVAHTATEAQLEKTHFVNIDASRVAIFVQGSDTRILAIDPSGSSSSFQESTYFTSDAIPSAPVSNSSTNTGTGYTVEYLFTRVKNGVESEGLANRTGSLPIATSESNTKVVDVGVSGDILQFSELRVYRRPRTAANGGGYGYIGSSHSPYTSGGRTLFDFIDFGQDADYSQSPPTTNIDIVGKAGSTAATPLSLDSRTGCMYQQRFLMSYLDRIFSSRTGRTGNFYQDHPLTADSSLSLKIGGNGYSEIMRMIDNDGLVAFTSNGVYLHLGALSPTNLSFERKGNWIIDDRVPPLGIPGAVLFVDVLTNTVRQLTFSEEAGTYVAEELSIFSNHLFEEKRITSWAFQDGPFPLLWVTFNDGTYASFTYEREHQMKAWTRHDSGSGIEYVASKPEALNTVSGERERAEVIFITKPTTAGIRYIELGIPRYPTVDDIEDDSEADMQESIAAMDAVVSWSSLDNDALTNDDIILTPVTAGVWNGPLTLAVQNDAIWTTASGRGSVGAVHRHFHPVDKSVVDLVVTARASDNSLTVQPSATFPSEYATNPRLYLCKATFTGLGHLNGENVSVIVDGNVVGSPNNDIQDFPTCTPSGGSLTLPNSLKGAIVHIGRPYTMDIETLDIDTVEQRPVLLESKTDNKVYIRTHQSRGLYIGNRFPDDDKVAGDEAKGTNMVPLDTYLVDHEADDEIIGNRYDQPTSRRYEVTLPGDWKSNGRICIRQVDPLHFEILSIIPDLEDLRR